MTLPLDELRICCSTFDDQRHRHCDCIRLIALTIHKRRQLKLAQRRCKTPPVIEKVRQFCATSTRAHFHCYAIDARLQVDMHAPYPSLGHPLVLVQLLCCWCKLCRNNSIPVEKGAILFLVVLFSTKLLQPQAPSTSSSEDARCFFADLKSGTNTDAMLRQRSRGHQVEFE